MIEVVAHLKSAGPYSQSRYHQTEYLENENDDAYERRTWRNRMHSTNDGHVLIPPMPFKLSLDAGAKWANISIPGKRNFKYTKYFVSGVLVLEPLILDIKKDDVPGEWLFVPSDGKKGTASRGSRVSKCFGKINEWEGDVTYQILDSTITEEVFTICLETAGKFIGIGRFRPENGGFYGRYKVESVKWQK